MSHKGVRTLIEDVATSLGDDMQYTYARTSDFNNLRDKRYPFISTDPLSSVPVFAVDNIRNYVKRWSVAMAFYQIDRESSDQTQYAKILDEMDEYVDQFINKLNLWAVKQDSINEVILTGFSQQPFIKATADVLTGYTLTFIIEVPDTFDYCGIDC